MKRNKILIVIMVIVALAIMTCIFTACDEESDQPSINIKNINVAFSSTKEYKEETSIDPEQLPLDAKFPVYMHISFVAENTSDANQVLNTEIIIQGGSKIDAAFKGGIVMDEPPTDPNYKDPKTGESGLKIYELKTSLNSNSQVDLGYTFRIIVSDAIKKPSEKKMKIDFNKNNNVLSPIDPYIDGIAYVVYDNIDQPKNIRIEDGYLVWDDVKNNNGYMVTVDQNKSVKVSENKYSIRGMLGEHKFEIQTLADKINMQHSLVTEKIVNLSQLGVPNVVVDKAQNRISWDAVEGAVRYAVDINGTKFYTDQIFIDREKLVCGENAIKISAISNNQEVLDSDYSKVVNIHVLDAATISVSQPNISWELVPNATSYKIFIDNVFVCETSDNTYRLKSGKYKIKVVACSNLEYTFDSNYSNEVDIRMA